MTLNGWIQIALYCAIIIAITKPLGGYMTRVFNGERTFLSPVLRPIERVIYAICGVSEEDDQHWTVYAVAMLVFSLAGFVSLYALQRLQSVLPSIRRILPPWAIIWRSTPRSASSPTPTGSPMCRKRR